MSGEFILLPPPKSLKTFEVVFTWSMKDQETLLPVAQQCFGSPLSWELPLHPSLFQKIVHISKSAEEQFKIQISMSHTWGTRIRSPTEEPGHQAISPT